MIAGKIIRKNNVKFFDEFCDNEKADIEDLFEKSEYLEMFNNAFEGTYPSIKLNELNNKIPNILIQIKKHLDINGFNHYRPANQLATGKFDILTLSQETIKRFEKVFNTMNNLL
jgi:hypothetical protein